MAMASVGAWRHGRRIPRESEPLLPAIGQGEHIADGQVT